jgi:hypothetical protein
MSQSFFGKGFDCYSIPNFNCLFTNFLLGRKLHSEQFGNMKCKFFILLYCILESYRIVSSFWHKNKFTIFVLISFFSIILTYVRYDCRLIFCVCQLLTIVILNNYYYYYITIFLDDFLLMICIYFSLLHV